MKTIFLEKVLRDIEYPITEKNKQLVNSLLEQSSQDIEYIWTKIPVLKDRLKHVKGFISVSNSHNKVKIGFDKDVVVTEIEDEFFDICRQWQDKYKIDLEFDYEKTSFYIT